ncbi:MAG: ATP-binding cassette domain-containing protein [Pseudomonadota bacterium]|nr:ATP-binding cassette domain-containing protein [Pseudomonadota bacterium]
MRCEKLSQSFGGVQALDSITLDFSDHGIVALIGPNGAGKSTLINVVTGFVRPEQGHCFVKGIDTTHWAIERIASLGVRRTFQAVRVFPEMTVSSNLLIGIPGDTTEDVLSICRPGLRRTAEEEKLQRVSAALRSTGLWPKARELARTLSYGQQKLLSLAMCMASGAKIVLLDEPFAGLDPETAETVTNILREMQKLKRLVIFIEHDLIAVGRIADVVHLLAGGKVIQSGLPDEVLTSRKTLERYFG